jgi:hypothetical protein
MTKKKKKMKNVYLSKYTWFPGEMYTQKGINIELP